MARTSRGRRQLKNDGASAGACWLSLLEFARARRAEEVWRVFSPNLALNSHAAHIQRVAKPSGIDAARRGDVQLAVRCGRCSLKLRVQISVAYGGIKVTHIWHGDVGNERNRATMLRKLQACSIGLQHTTRAGFTPASALLLACTQTVHICPPGA